MAGALQRLHRLECRLDAQGRQGMEQLFRHGAIGPEPAEHHATGEIAMERGPRALIANHGRPGILRQQFGPTMPTAQQPGQEGPTPFD